MNELLKDYLREVASVLAALDADVGSRNVAPDGEWIAQIAALRDDLQHMVGMSAEQLAVAIANARPRLARLGALYLHMSRDIDR